MSEALKCKWHIFEIRGIHYHQILLHHYFGSNNSVGLFLHSERCRVVFIWQSNLVGICLGSVNCIAWIQVNNTLSSVSSHHMCISTVRCTRGKVRDLSNDQVGLKCVTTSAFRTQAPKPLRVMTGSNSGTQQSPANLDCRHPTYLPLCRSTAIMLCRLFQSRKRWGSGKSKVWSVILLSEKMQ